MSSNSNPTSAVLKVKITPTGYKTQDQKWTPWYKTNFYAEPNRKLVVKVPNFDKETVSLGRNLPGLATVHHKADGSRTDNKTFDYNPNSLRPEFPLGCLVIYVGGQYFQGGAATPVGAEGYVYLAINDAVDHNLHSGKPDVPYSSDGAYEDNEGFFEVEISQSC